MDIASLIGIIGAVVMIIGPMIYAGGVAPFVDYASLVIVFGGTVFVVMLTKPMGVFLSHFKAMGKAFKSSVPSVEELIARMVELSTIARKDGMMALEGQAVPDKLVKQLKLEIKAMKSRHEANQGAVKAWVDYGPAMGMVGTLIGLVLMLGNMSDPKSIGPSMAVALLTTLYGALVANVIFGPILVKLEGLTGDEVEYRQMVIEGLRGIARGDSPRNVQENMISILPPKAQEKLMAA
jgi:chemotaxis protein MotA